MVSAEYAAKTWKVTHDLEKAQKSAAAEGFDPLKMVTDLLDTVTAQVVDVGVPEEYAQTSVLVALALVVLTTLWWCVSGDEESIGDSSDDEPEPEPVKEATKAEVAADDKEEEEEEEKEQKEDNPAEEKGPTTRSKAKGKKGGK